MLPAAHRLTDAASFRDASRRGRRAATPTVVVHAWAGPAAVEGTGPDTGPARVGFVVSKAVGGSVVRNRVKRRLRHLVAGHLDGLPSGSVLVVRALPRAAGVSSVDLGRDLASGLRRAGVPAAGATA